MKLGMSGSFAQRSEVAETIERRWMQMDADGCRWMQIATHAALLL